MSGVDESLEGLVKFGQQTENFLKSPIGKFLLDRSKEQIDAAVEKLKRVAPDDVREITRLQNEIFRNESVEQWIGEIIHSGWEALNLLDGVE